jgi:hypothetical protein
MLAALAHREMATERVVVLAEKRALAPGAALTQHDGEGRLRRIGDTGNLILGRYSVKIVALNSYLRDHRFWIE